MRAVVEQFGGTVEKFAGDAVVAVFGVPTQHEDDAERAVRCALGLREALVGLERHAEAALRRRRSPAVGVVTGEAVVGGEALATGETMNTAARLEQVPRPGRSSSAATRCSRPMDAVQYGE